MKILLTNCVIAGAVVLLAGCAAAPPDNFSQGTLSACPATPNCVNSETGGIQALVPAGDIRQTWLGLVSYLQSEPNITLVVQQDLYLRAEARTSLFGFVDDLEFLLQPDKNQIAVRSASRVGFSDLGTNGRRIERLREALAALGLVTDQQ